MNIDFFGGFGAGLLTLGIIILVSSHFIPRQCLEANEKHIELQTCVKYFKYEE